MLSAALAVFVAPSGQEKAYAQASVKNYVFSLSLMAALLVGITAWQYFDPANHGGTTFHLPFTFGVMLLCVFCLYLGRFAGIHLGQAAKRGDAMWLARLLGWLTKSIA